MMILRMIIIPMLSSMSISRAHSMIILQISAMAPLATRARICGQSFNLQHLGYLHELLQLGVFHIHLALIHELQQFRHDGETHVFQNY